MDYQSLQKQRAYIEALLVAHEAVERGKALTAEKEQSQDINTIRESCANVAIAGEGVKAELCGTLEAEPTATVESLVAWGFDEKVAEDMVAAGKAIHADALELRKPIAVAAIEEPPEEANP